MADIDTDFRPVRGMALSASTPARLPATGGDPSHRHIFGCSVAAAPRRAAHRDRVRIRRYACLRAFSAHGNAHPV